MRTLLEVQLDQLTHSVRSKELRWQKLQDCTIVSRWRHEAVQQCVSEELFEFAVKVLPFTSLHNH